MRYLPYARLLKKSLQKVSTESSYILADVEEDATEADAMEVTVMEVTATDVTMADAIMRMDTTADAIMRMDTTADAVVINKLKSGKICGYCWHLYRRPF